MHVTCTKNRQTLNIIFLTILVFRMPTQYPFRKWPRNGSNEEHHRQKAYVTLDRKWTSKDTIKVTLRFSKFSWLRSYISKETEFVRSAEKYFNLPLKIECSLRRYPFDSSIAITFEINRKKTDKKTFVNSIAKFSLLRYSADSLQWDMDVYTREG